ncbi:MAG TPA: hypothetical protein VF945_09890 [Polyangia bacterium]
MKKRPPPRRPRSPRRALGAIVVVVGALLLVLLLRPRAAPPPSPVPEVREPAPRSAGTPAFAQYTPPSAPRKLFPETVDKAEFNRRKAAVAEQALKDVQTWIKYPLWSAPLTENMRYHKPEPAHTRAAGPGDQEPSVELWPERLNYGLNEPIRILAVAHGKGGLTTLESVTARTVGGVRTRPEYPLEFTDRGDGVYVANLTVPEGIGMRNRGDWGVMLDCVVEGEHRVAHTQFNLMATDARVTGPYRMTVENGSLVAYVGITAERPSRQHLKGELWGPKGEPISYAWVRNDETPSGTSTMKLVFYGKVIRDSGVDGPYHLRNLLLTTFEDNNDRIVNPAVDVDLASEPWPHTMFTDVSINATNETLLEKQQILAQELAQARAGQYDPNQPIPPHEPVASKDVPPPQ